jgi:hypothetical protein
MLTKEAHLKQVVAQHRAWDDRMDPLQAKVMIGQAVDERGMIPAPVLVQLQQAHEILLTVHGPLDAELWSALVTLPPHSGATVTVLLDRVFDAAYVLQMIEAGFSVYDTTLPDEALIFLDRYHGYYLPEWAALPRSLSFSLACHLAWNRIGGYGCVRDTVAELTDSGLMKVVGRPHLWFNVRHVVNLPQVGEHVTILTYQPFLAAGSRLRDAIAILVDKENP